MAIVLAAMAVLNPSVFYSASNFSSMAVQFPELGFLSIAAALVLMSGGIDLSITGTAVFSGIVAAQDHAGLGQSGQSVCHGGRSGPGAAALLVGLACGAVNAVLVAKVGIAPMLVTLGTMNLFTGIGIVLPRAPALSGSPASFLAIGSGRRWGSPSPSAVRAGHHHSGLLPESRPSWAISCASTAPTRGVLLLRHQQHQGGIHHLCDERP